MLQAGTISNMFSRTWTEGKAGHYHHKGLLKNVEGHFMGGSRSAHGTAGVYFTLLEMEQTY